MFYKKFSLVCKMSKIEIEPTLRVNNKLWAITVKNRTHCPLSEHNSPYVLTMNISMSDIIADGYAGA